MSGAVGYVEAQTPSAAKQSGCGSPLGLARTQRTSSVILRVRTCVIPSRRTSCSSCSIDMCHSQSLTSLSALPLTKPLPSGSAATDHTGPLCAATASTCSAAPTSRISSRPSCTQHRKRHALHDNKKSKTKHCASLQDGSDKAECCGQQWARCPSSEFDGT